MGNIDLAVPGTKLTTTQRAERAAAACLAQLLGIGISAGLRPYRPQRWSRQRWEDAYECGEFDYLSDPCELPRYSVLIGYLRTFADRPAVLDIGCGAGWLRQLLADTDFSSYTGIDISKKAIDKAAILADSRTDFILGDVGEAELPQVDVVVLNEVLYYISSPDAFLEQIKSLVRPKGLVLTSIWRHAGDRALWRILDNHFDFISAARTRDEGSPYSRLGFRVSCHRAL
jgi:2-polyprenyl-3-methyl-5-hydroxy-6-metoxy-1,4-benzoquinol methylase